MKKHLFSPCLASLLGLVVGATIANADFLPKPNDVLGICGDSITEQKQYSVFIEDYLLACQPTENLRMAQFGWGGEQANGFLARLTTDVFPFKPTIVTTCYGMNDGGYKPLEQTVADRYRKNQTSTVEALKKAGVRSIIVGSPGCVDSFYFRSKPELAVMYNKTLGSLRDIAREVAEKEGVGFADLHEPMMETMAKVKAANGDNFSFAGTDGVHPTANGHLVMAYAFLKALGCDGAIGTLTVDLAKNHAEGTAGQKILSFQGGSMEIESSRYPFCFQGKTTDPQATSGIVNFFPFNEDLNRYLLVVRGLTAPKATVTWGSESKEFAAADLAKGINLAAEFLNNPFCETFTKIDAAVRAQQNPETILVKQLLHSLPTFKAMSPKHADSLDQVAQEAIQHDLELSQEAAAAVVPVRHTLKIQPSI